MFRCTATNLDTQPKTMQQRLMCALENARLLPDVCCCFNNMGNKILFRINWRRVNQSFNVASQEDVHWCKVWWPGRPSDCTAPYNPAIVVSCGGMLTLQRISFPLSLRQQQLSGSNLAFLSTHVVSAASMLACIKADGCTFEHYSKLVWNTTFFRVLLWFCLISNLSQT